MEAELKRLAKAETVSLPTHLVATKRQNLPPGSTLSYQDYLAVSGLAGGLTGWPFQPGWFSPEVDEGEGASMWRTRMVMPGAGGGVADLPLAAEWLQSTQSEERLTDVRLAAGRAVVWSVGVDKRDGSDLMYPVADPPAAK